MVSPITVRQWAQKGMLEARTTAGGHRRFLIEDVKQFAQARNIDLRLDTPAVLVVDDDRQLNNFLVDLLSAHTDEMAIYSAYDGFEAGRLVTQHKPQIVLLDIMMPGMNGVEVCRAIKGEAQTAHARVIGMTGRFTDQVEQDMLEAGAEVLLKKPFSNDDILRRCGLASLQSA